MMENTDLARRVFQSLRGQGVTEFCVCPGARNAPLVKLLAANSEICRVFYFYEERSAAFFAVGRIRAIQQPVAVVTTSGTAAGELLPATMEAYYSGLPLILITADRPKEFRGSGSPQAAEQVGIFGIYVSQCLDWDVALQVKGGLLDLKRPLHLNLCFNEPLLEADAESNLQPYLFQPSLLDTCSPNQVLPLPVDETDSVLKVQNFLGRVTAPLVIVGMLGPDERESVIQFLLRLKVPTYLEGLSGLREDLRLNSVRIRQADRVLERSQKADYPWDSLIRIGGIPTHRIWRDMEEKMMRLPVLSISRLRFSGLGRPSEIVSGSLSQICKNLCEILEKTPVWPHPLFSEDACRRFLRLDRDADLLLQELLQEEAGSEPGILSFLSRQIPRNSRIYLGNSLPIREWDLSATAENREFEIWGSRGLNGIDGQVSTFFGFAERGVENWGIFGDLTALYDLSAPWVLPQLTQTQVNLVVINNGGGKIFSQKFPQMTEFQNSHHLSFRGWSDLWSLQYEKWNSKLGSIDPVRNNRLLEITPDEAATERFWKKFRKF